jgi:hypothetical protein
VLGCCENSNAALNSGATELVSQQNEHTVPGEGNEVLVWKPIGKQPREKL